MFACGNIRFGQGADIGQRPLNGKQLVTLHRLNLQAQRSPHPYAVHLASSMTDMQRGLKQSLEPMDLQFVGWILTNASRAIRMDEETKMKSPRLGDIRQ